MDMRPTAYFLDEFDSAGELVDREYNGINQFSWGRGNGTPLYTQQQLEAAIEAMKEKAAKVAAELYAQARADEIVVAIKEMK